MGKKTSHEPLKSYFFYPQSVGSTHVLIRVTQSIALAFKFSESSANIATTSVLQLLVSVQYLILGERAVREIKNLLPWF